mmetsp:Transcript_25552/g.37748  ORF Transcript_25552/g.37748 Transcript_25552/m.37748 type:complete len:354 (+) Transcript_25552:319-1380(+)
MKQLTMGRTSLGNAPQLTVWVNAFFYVLSGCCQPLIMTLCKNAGLADPSCQLAMFFYALGPFFLVIPVLIEGWFNPSYVWPTTTPTIQAIGICLFDIVATLMNYTGASMAGPTIFSIVYSSVTVWTALFSQLFLQRLMTKWQWCGVTVVFGGLILTATDSLELGGEVINGLTLVLVGSALHASTYIMCEGIMTTAKERLTVLENNAIQSSVATLVMLVWQLVYTIPNWDEKLGQPMRASGTTLKEALGILLLFGFSNLIHSYTFYYTLRYIPGGSTSAGVMKGLQAVLVFVVTHFTFCGRIAGNEMCFTKGKFLALVTVTGGVIEYGVATTLEKQNQGPREGYQPIHNDLVSL